MPRSELEVVGITFTHECSNSSPRYMRENHYAILVCNCEISYVSNSQDEHNASFFMFSGKFRFHNKGTKKCVNCFFRSATNPAKIFLKTNMDLRRYAPKSGNCPCASSGPPPKSPCSAVPYSVFFTRKAPDRMRQCSRTAPAACHPAAGKLMMRHVPPRNRSRHNRPETPPVCLPSSPPILSYSYTAPDRLSADAPPHASSGQKHSIPKQSDRPACKKGA